MSYPPACEQQETPQPDHVLSAKAQKAYVQMEAGQTAQVLFNGHTIWVTKLENGNMAAENEQGKKYMIGTRHTLQVSRGNNSHWYAEDKRRDYPQISNLNGTLEVNSVSDEILVAVYEKFEQQSTNSETPLPANSREQFAQPVQQVLTEPQVGEAIQPEPGETLNFKNFNTITCAIGLGQSTTVVSIHKVKDNYADVRIDDIGYDSEVNNNQYVVIGRDEQPELEDRKSISRKHLTIGFHDNVLQITSHSKIDGPHGQVIATTVRKIN